MGFKRSRDARDAVDGDAERAGLQQRGGGLLGQPAEEAAAGRTETEARTSLPPPARASLVGDVEGDGAVRGEREAAVAGLVDLDVEADAAADQPAGDAHARAGREPRAGAPSRSKGTGDQLRGRRPGR